MATFTTYQRRSAVEYLGGDVDHLRKGHNTLEADIEGTDLSHAWIEFDLDGSGFETMCEFGVEEARHFQDAPDGTAISNISCREGMGVRYTTTSQNELRLVYGDNNGTDVYVATSSGDPTSFGSPTLVHSEPDKAESPAWFYDDGDGTLHLYFEDSGPDSLAHGYVAIFDADTTAGESYSNKRLIGGDKWPMDELFASPYAWQFNDNYFISGELVDAPVSNLQIAKGPEPDDFNENIIAADANDFPKIDRHIAMKDKWVSADGTFYSYINPVWESDGNYGSAPFWTSEYSNNYPVNWNLEGRHLDYVATAVLDLFNEKYVYGLNVNEKDRIYYWHLSGTPVEESVPSSGGSVSFEYYQPSVPPGSTITWRVAVEKTDGTVERSASKSFDVKRDPEVKIGTTKIRVDGTKYTVPVFELGSVGDTRVRARTDDGQVGCLKPVTSSKAGVRIGDEIVRLETA